MADKTLQELMAQVPPELLKYFSANTSADFPFTEEKVRRIEEALDRIELSISGPAGQPERGFGARLFVVEERQDEVRDDLYGPEGIKKRLTSLIQAHTDRTCDKTVNVPSLFNLGTVPATWFVTLLRVIVILILILVGDAGARKMTGATDKDDLAKTAATIVQTVLQAQVTPQPPQGGAKP